MRNKTKEPNCPLYTGPRSCCLQSTFWMGEEGQRCRGCQRHTKGNATLHQRFSIKTFLIWDTHLAGGHQPQNQCAIQIMVQIRVSVQISTKPTASWILGLTKSFQKKHGTAPTLLLQQVYHL